MRRPHIHKDWKFILRYAWSVRLNIASGVFSGIAVALPLIQPYVSINPVWPAVGAGIFTAAAIIARIMSQRTFEKAGKSGL